MASVGGQSGNTIEDALRRGMAALQNRRPDEAERIARDVLARQAQHIGALHLFGLALMSQGRAREAVTPLEAALRLQSSPVIETHLAIALRQSGQSAEALKRLEHAVTLQPAFPLAFHELGVLLFSLRRLDEAEAVLRRGIERAPAMPELSVVLGGILLDRADWAGAKAAFARVLELAPRQPSALYGLGTALLEAGEFNLAAERFRQALAVDPAYAQARLSLGTCLLELGQPRRSDRLFARGGERRPATLRQGAADAGDGGRGQFWLKPSDAAEVLKQGGGKG